MATSIALQTTKEDLLAQAILQRLDGAQPGHCARVDFLPRAEASAVCERVLREVADDRLLVKVLAQRAASATNSADIFVGIDQAIELRNRKKYALCLFIPADLVDSAASSLANSFEVIDARDLYKQALDQLRAQLSDQAARIVNAVFGRVRTTANDAQRLDYVSAVERCQSAPEEAGALGQSGLELWRVGLIADGAADFTERLDKNRECARKLTRPSKMQATPAERVGETGVTPDTARMLVEFFRQRSMNDIAAWSRALAQRTTLTFDQWQFIEEEHSDLRAVTVDSFIDSKTKRLARWSKLKYVDEQDPENSAFKAEYGPKCTMVVRWETEPQKPNNLGGWRVEFAPAGGDEDDVVEELPSREIPATRRETTIKLDNLDLDGEDRVDYPVCIRVTPLDAAKNAILDSAGRRLAQISQDFYLAPQGTPVEPGRRESRKGALNIPFGRLSYLVSSSEPEVREEAPQWVGDNAFQLKLNGKQIVRVEVSPILLALGEELIKDPRGLHSFVTRVSDVEPINVTQQIEAVRPTNYGRESWKSFWNARANFFDKLSKAGARKPMEVVDWTEELAGFALRYGRQYINLLDELIEAGARDEIADALGIDALVIHYDDRNGDPVSLITLPTHPLRAVWLANYALLLRKWEQDVVEFRQRKRSLTCDIKLLEMVAPANTPAFSSHASTTIPFVYCQSLQFFYGVSLPATVAEPQRRLDDLAIMLGVEVAEAAEDGPTTERLTHYMERFLDTHPYVETLAMTTVNPDRGEMLATALRRLFERRVVSDDDGDANDSTAPRLDLTAYTAQPQRGALQALAAVRISQMDQQGQPGDEWRPALSVTIKPRAQLDKAAPRDAHLALVSDLTRPEIHPVAVSDQMGAPGDEARPSFSLYGLVARFVSRLSVDEHGSAICRYTINASSASKGQKHPVSSFTDALIDLHASQLAACAMAFGGDKEQTPALDVMLDATQRRTLDSLHQQTNWVITSDRHFALEYYDSPHVGALASLAEMYVLDYTPEFTEGMGRRMLATTSWRDEVTIVMRRAMEELGLRAVEASVRGALQTLKTVSGGLALQTLMSSSNAAAAAGLAIVTARLKSQRKLEQAVLIPVDLHPGIFTPSGVANAHGERRCDLVLIALKRDIVEATFIEVKWRRGNAPIDDLIHDMYSQIDATAQAMESRFFADDARADGALQRSQLANVLRFYFERAKRYGLLESEAQMNFMGNLNRLEKSGLSFRPTKEGYIVNLDGEQRTKPMTELDARFYVITAADLEQLPEFSQFGPGGSTNPESPTKPDGSASSSRRMLSPAGEMSSGAAAGSTGVGADDDGEGAVHAAPSAPAEDSEATVASSLPDTSVSVALGETHGEIVSWKPSVKGSPHLFIAGMPGQGKSVTTLRLLTELGRQGVPALVLDFHGQFAEPGNPYMRAAHPTILDAAEGLPFSPFDLSSDANSVSWRAASYELAEILGYVAGLGEIQQDALRVAIRDAYTAHGFDQSGDYKELSLPTLEDVLLTLERLESTRRTANVLARCRPLLEMDLFRPQQDTPDLITLARAGLVIDLHHLYAESVQLAAGAFVLRKIYRDMFHWGVAERLRLAIVLDEAHRLAKDVTLPKIMKEGRKFGVSVVVASQGMADFHADILGNAGAKVIFRTNYPDSRKIAGFIRTRPGFDLAQRLEQLSVGYAFVQTPEMPYGTLVRMFAAGDERR